MKGEIAIAVSPVNVKVIRDISPDCRGHLLRKATESSEERPHGLQLARSQGWAAASEVIQVGCS